MFTSVPTAKFALLNNNSGEALNPDVFYLEVLQTPTSANGYVGFAVYVDRNEDTRDYIKFQPNESGPGFSSIFLMDWMQVRSSPDQDENSFNISPIMEEDRAVGLQLKFDTLATPIDFVLFSELFVETSVDVVRDYELRTPSCELTTAEF